MASLLTVRDLYVAFPESERTVEAVRGVSFEIGEGETLALVGESGSGKSVTALSTVGLLPDTAIVRGSVDYGGRQMIGASQRELMQVRGNDISFVFQEPMTSLNPLHTIEKQVGESLLIHQGLTGKPARERTLELLERVGIPNPAERLDAWPHQLSGGQRQRVMIAMALANKPDLLIADEPTTALDVTIQAQILDLLAELQRAEGLSMLFITHDLHIVRKVAHRVAVMKDGEIVETGRTGEVFDRPQHAYTKMLLGAEPKGRPIPIPRDARPLVEGRAIRVWFPIQRGVFKKTVGHIKACTDVDIDIAPAETLGVVGESGSGKTSLGLALMRLIRSEGRITFDGHEVQALRKRDLRAMRRNMQIVFQDPYGSLSPRMSVAEIIAEGLGVHRVGGNGASKRELVAEAMGEVGLDAATMDRYPHEFSGGQRQRVAIARAMILKPKLLILDEPTSALDMTVQKQIVDLLRELQRRHRLAYIFISHDLRVVRAMAHKLIVMKDGEVVEAGTADEIFDAPRTDYARALMAAAFDLEVMPGVSE